MDSALAYNLAARYDTPFYAYDLHQVKERVAALRDALPRGSRLYLSLKANPLPALGREARAHGCGAEITSLGELAAAQAAGFPGSEIVAGGPAKTPAFLQASLAAGVTAFSCESFNDLARLSAACEQAGVDATVLLRVNPAEAPEARLAMTGVESQFGFAEPALLDPAVRSQVYLPRLRIAGVHVYYGTQVAGTDALVRNTRNALLCALRIRDALRFDCTLVNAGGGFPWPYANDAAPPDFEGLRAKLEEVWQNCPLHAEASLAFESGRYLTAGSGWLVSRVMDVKKHPSRTFVVLDTGIHHLGGMAGLGRVARSTLTVKNVSQSQPADLPMQADLTGPLCTPLDSLARNVTLPQVSVDDLVAIPNVGAYGLTASLTGFLSHPAPVEVCHRCGVVEDVYSLRTGHELVPSPTIRTRNPYDD